MLSYLSTHGHRYLIQRRQTSSPNILDQTLLSCAICILEVLHILSTSSRHLIFYLHSVFPKLFAFIPSFCSMARGYSLLVFHDVGFLHLGIYLSHRFSSLFIHFAVCLTLCCSVMICPCFPGQLIFRQRSTSQLRTSRLWPLSLLSSVFVFSCLSGNY